MVADPFVYGCSCRVVAVLSAATVAVVDLHTATVADLHTLHTLICC